jgi:hypothetical protein
MKYLPDAIYSYPGRAMAAIGALAIIPGSPEKRCF